MGHEVSERSDEVRRGQRCNGVRLEDLAHPAQQHGIGVVEHQHVARVVVTPHQSQVGQRVAGLELTGR